jgi:hypothetical protein
MSHHWRDIRRQLSPEQEEETRRHVKSVVEAAALNEPREQEQVNKAGESQAPGRLF